MERKQVLQTYVWMVAALGAAALAQSLRTLDLTGIDPLMLAILVGLAAAAQRMPVFLFRSSAISISFAAVIASFKASSRYASRRADSSLPLRAAPRPLEKTRIASACGNFCQARAGGDSSSAAAFSQLLCSNVMRDGIEAKA